MAKVLIFSDLHLHNWREFSHIDSKTGLNSRLLDGIKALQQVHDYANENQIRHILFLGDLFHRGNLLSPDLLEVTIDELRAIRNDRISSIFLCGQHDQMNTSGLKNALRPLSDYVTVIDEATTFEIEGVRFGACPCRRYIPDQYRELGKLEGVEIDFFLGHFLCKQLLDRTEHFPCVDYHETPEALKRCHLWLLGDYHPPRQAMGGERTTILSIGSLVHHSFGDSQRDRNGRFLELPIDIGVPVYHYINAPMFIDVTAREMLDKWDHTKPTIHFYRVSVTNQEEANELIGKFEDWHIRLVYQQEPTLLDTTRIEVNFETAPNDILREYAMHAAADKLKRDLDDLIQVGLGYVDCDSDS